MFVPTVLALLVPTVVLSGGQPAPSPARTKVGGPVAPREWFGDLDGMTKRRIIRVLVVTNKTNYFVDRGTQHGMTFEAMQMFESDLNKKLKTGNLKINVVFVPVGRDELIPHLVAGKGDIAAASLTITPDRLKQIDFTDPVRTNVSEIVVTGPGAQPFPNADALSGSEVFIRKSSSYHASVLDLNARLTKAGKKPVAVKLAPEELQDEDLLEMVNAGLVKATIVDDFSATFWKQVLPDLVLHPNAAVRTGGDIAMMIRKNSPLLKAELNAFFKRYPEGSAARNMLLQKYLKSTKFVKNATSEAELKKFHDIIEFFRKYGAQYDLDFVLMAAQGYQESRLDQKVKSHVGAVGVMQVMPPTGKDMKVGDITQVEPNIHAGVKYMRFMMDQYFEKEPMTKLNKALFTFAAYNCGPGRIAQLRRAAVAKGLDPNVWFNNVEVVASERIGRETVTYVSNIYKYYIAYTLSIEEGQARTKAKEALTK